jgi:rubrerythrin
MKTLFEDLAVMEDGHAEVFSAMRGRLTEQQKEPTVFDPDDQIGLYLQAMADGKGYEGKLSPDQELTGRETAEQVLNIALRAEHKSVVVDVGLKALVRGDQAEAQVEKIIQEEMGHIATLYRRLISLA